MKKSIIVNFSIIIVCFSIIVLVWNNIIPLSDDYEEEFERIYQITTYDDAGLETIQNPDGSTSEHFVIMSIVNKTNNFLALKGLIKLETPSGSEKYPITAKINLDVLLNERGPLSANFEDLPSNLHFEFLGAKNLGSEENSGNNFATIIVEKKKIFDKPYYFGEGEIVYEESGEYDFHMKEANEQEKNLEIEQNSDGTYSITFFYPITDDSVGKGFKVFELFKENNKKIKIDPYSQTIDLETYKATWYTGLIGVIATFGYKLSKNIFEMRKTSLK